MIQKGYNERNENKSAALNHHDCQNVEPEFFKVAGNHILGHVHGTILQHIKRVSVEALFMEWDKELFNGINENLTDC